MSMYVIGCRQKIKKIPRALFSTGLTQGSIWRHFFCRRVSFYLAPRAFYAAPHGPPQPYPPYGLVCLPLHQSILKLEFFDDFRIYGRAFNPVSAELFQLQIGCFKKKLRPSEDGSFSLFLCTHAWEEHFSIIKKRQNDLSSDGRNFLGKQPICNRKSSAETGVHALPYMRKSAKNSNLNIHF